MKELRELVEKWQKLQDQFDEISQTSTRPHSQIRFAAKAQTFRDCWKELKTILDTIAIEK